MSSANTAVPVVATAKEATEDDSINVLTQVILPQQQAGERRSWLDFYKGLSQFYKVNGHANLPTNYVRDPALGQWVQEQRERLAKNEVSDVQEKVKLRAVGLVAPSDAAAAADGQVDTDVQTDVNTDTEDLVTPLSRTGRRSSVASGDRAWMESASKLKKFHDYYGHWSLTHHALPVDPALVRFAKRQRTMLLDNKLKLRRLQILQDMGFPWSFPPLTKEGLAAMQEWNQMYGQLKKYARTHGHANVPPFDVANLELAQWAAEQRFAYDNDLLPEDRIDLLADLKFHWVDDPTTAVVTTPQETVAPSSEAMATRGRKRKSSLPHDDDEEEEDVHMEDDDDDEETGGTTHLVEITIDSDDEQDNQALQLQKQLLRVQNAKHQIQHHKIRVLEESQHWHQWKLKTLQKKKKQQTATPDAKEKESTALERIAATVGDATQMVEQWLGPDQAPLAQAKQARAQLEQQIDSTDRKLQEQATMLQDQKQKMNQLLDQLTATV